MKFYIALILSALLLFAIVCGAETTNLVTTGNYTNSIFDHSSFRSEAPAVMSNIKIWIMVAGAIATALGSVLVHGYQIVTTAGGWRNILNRLEFGSTAPLITAPAPDNQLTIELVRKEVAQMIEATKTPDPTKTEPPKS